MFDNTGMSRNQAPENTSRQLGTEEFIGRLADNLRQNSDSDLPRSYFIEQVKLQLAGEQSEATQDRASNAAANRYQSSDCFKSWAIPE